METASYHTETVPNEWRNQARDQSFREWIDAQALDFDEAEFDAFASAPVTEPCTQCNGSGRAPVTGPDLSGVYAVAADPAVAAVLNAIYGGGAA